MSGEVTLDIALQRVQSSGIKERAEGLKDLKHVLRNNSRFDILADNSFHRIFEVLFGIAITEQSTYLKAKTSTTRSAAENRLSACSSVLRSAVEVGVRHVKAKTLRSVLDHVIETSVLPSEKFCEPLAADYVKSLKSLLSYQPHVEHLSKDDRERAAAFCIRCVGIVQAESTENGAAPGAEYPSTGGAINGLSHRSSRSVLKDSGGSQGNRSMAKQMAEEIAIIMSLLTSAPNGAPGEYASDLLSAATSLLQNSALASSSRQHAFATINHILAWIRTEDVELMQKMITPLIRLIRQYWTAKSSLDRALSATRDEMLITLLYLEPYANAAISGEDDWSLRSEILSLLDVMRNEYSRRTERDQLRFEDLRLHFHDARMMSKGQISTSIFRLRNVHARGEACWTVVYMLATLSHAVMNPTPDTEHSESDDEDNIDNRPRKRQRMTDEFADTMESSITGSVTSRVCALQTLIFLTQQRRFKPRDLGKAVEKVSSSAAEDNSLIASWAMLCLASLASQLSSTESPLLTRWLSVWQIACRAMSNASTCRAACHLVLLMLKVRLIPQRQISELVQTVTSAINLAGPSVFADSVSQLLIHTVKASQQTNPTTSNVTAESILGWLFRNIRPSRFADREYASQNALFESQDLIQLVYCCISQDNHDAHYYQAPVWEAVAQVWLQCTQQRDLVSYLLLLPQPTQIINDGVRFESASKSSLNLPRPTCEAVVLNSLISEMYRAQEDWDQLVREKPQGISLDAFTFYCMSCLMGTCLAFCSSLRDTRRQNQLQRQMTETLRSLGEFISSPNCGDDKIDVLMSTFSSVCSRLVGQDTVGDISQCETHVCRAVAKAMRSRSNKGHSRGLDEHHDEMDIDDVEESQASRRSETSTDSYVLENELAVEFSGQSLRSCMTTYAIAIRARSVESGRDNDDTQSASAVVIDHVLALAETSVILSAKVICSLSNIGIELTTDDCDQLLDYCADRILQPYAYDRSEVALNAVLDIMSSLATVLTDESNKSLYNLGIDMYNWYTSVVLRAGVLSPSVQKRVATLLLQLCHVDTDYGRDEERDVPSVRTSLFKLVELGSLTVKHFLATRISTIFGLFILSNHPAMFDDLQMSLPEDAEWLEGMSMRLLFFAKLASAWHSLLRQCVYYIFETGARVKKASKYAARCATELATALKFDSSQRLFELFGPQLLHTWLESNSIKSLPFETFQYETLNALIEHNQSELTAQMLVRANDPGMQIVMDTLKASSKTLIMTSFAKCYAYCLGWDISNSSPGSNDATCESRLRKITGSKEEHKLLVNEHFAAIMGYLYLSSQLDDLHDAWLEKRPGYTTAAKALQEMKNFSHSDRALPTVQEPCFKGKHLPDQIERLCRRTSLDPANPWDASTFALATRMLLDSIDPALGPLHTCIVIRKLRLLVCMAGSVAVSGFPLEMLIHSLHPFLSDSQCADDTIGVLQYLFHHGREYLSADLPFLHGTIVLMVLRMRKHSEARPESTTQESQHRSTVERMERFRSWLVNYLKTCEAVQSEPTGGYRSIADALAKLNLPGNAYKSSPESSLLLLLLADSSRSKKLLRDSNCHEALTLLSERFEAPTSAADDCLEHDIDCVKYEQSLFDAMQMSDLSETFRGWAAIALGRAYASRGQRPLTTASTYRTLRTQRAKESQGIAASQSIITTRLCDDLFSRTLSGGSLADHTLRRMLHSSEGSEEILALQQMLPSAIVSALAGGTHGYNPRLGSRTTSQPQSMQQLTEPSQETTAQTWAQSIALAVCQENSNTLILSALKDALLSNAALAMELLPCIIHIVLVNQAEREQILRLDLSKLVTAHFDDASETIHPKQQLLIELLLYLKEQPLPGETTHADRLRWLDIDWLLAAETAKKCSMWSAALMFIESTSTPAHGNKRASSRASLTQISLAQVSEELLLSVFKQLEEPDSFYGVEQSPTLESVLDRLDYERDGYRSLMFRSAQTDTHLRSTRELSQTESGGIIRSLSMLNLNSLTFSLLSSGHGSGDSAAELLNSARQLQRWDIMPSDNASGGARFTFAAFQELSRATSREEVLPKLRSIINNHIESIADDERPRRLPHTWYAALASFTEISEIICCNDRNALQARWDLMRERQSWMSTARYEDFQLLLSNRYTLLSVLAQKESILSEMHIGAKDCGVLEIKSLLDISRLARQHGQLQEALAAANQCNALVEDSSSVVLRAEVAAKVETASVLWDMSEVTPSVRMLLNACESADIEISDVPVGRPGLLAQIAYQVAEARVEKPEAILTKYLKPAIAQLHGHNEGQDAGKVFHEFATFCDKQLQNPGNLEDFNRIAKLRQRKLEEWEALQRMPKSSFKSTDDKADHVRSIDKAKTWYDIDDADYQRLKRSRDTYMEQSLQNYLLALSASDEHDLSVLRFFTLWLENAESVSANKIVGKYLPKVPSWKFVVLVHQLMSRLEQDSTAFQASLRALITRICSDHPHHSLHHLFTATRKPTTRDDAAISRYKVAAEIRQQAKSVPKAAEQLENIFLADNYYHALANTQLEKAPAGGRVAIKDIPEAYNLMKKIPTLHVPPVTMNVPLRPDGSYSDIPEITSFYRAVSFMSGISRPKKLIAYASDGLSYVQLFKGPPGKDDPRQDAIMEQVFGEVSKMLRNHKATRQRDLHVRTYKVIPLSTQTGVIEFVPNSISLTDYLVAAHERYHPQDYKYKTARDRIETARSHSTETRVKEYQKVCDHLHPVLRHFFFERFKDPDEWFEKRTAYTRTTATISILGYVLGLGDRHCQNIMLDEKTGEVVHIDLGIAFEAGRVLPVPELVPFRLSRDVVDGMGITKTEGVFRRCCEFTMDALWEDKDSIMTLLNVLRYDPLYSWTLSPLRAKRMQEESMRNVTAAEPADGGSSRKKEQEAGEADRALSIVEKKLSKTLSTAATVNELIQQAADVRNLATLFSGWSAFY